MNQRWTFCTTCRELHFGAHGGAGVLIADATAEHWRFLMMRRGCGSELAGTWGIPGGARDDDESAAAAGYREVLEEIGLDLQRIPHEVLAAVVDDRHDSWSYVTVVVELDPADAPELVASEEAVEIRWVDYYDLARLDLHPPFARSLDLVAEALFDDAAAITAAEEISRTRAEAYPVAEYAAAAETPAWRYYVHWPYDEVPHLLVSPYARHRLEPRSRPSKARCVTNDHEAPHVGCMCGFTSARSLTALTNYMWVERLAYKTAFGDRNVNKLPHAVIARVTALGTVTAAREQNVGLMRHAGLRLEELYLSAGYEFLRDDFTAFYEVPVQVSAWPAGIEWLQDLAPDFAPDLSLCGTCWNAPPTAVYKNVCTLCERDLTPKVAQIIDLTQQRGNPFWDLAAALTEVTS